MPATWEAFEELAASGTWDEGPESGAWEDWEPLLQQMSPLPPDCEGFVLAESDVFFPREYFEQPPGKRILDPN